VLSALLWGAVAASSLVVGAVLALARRWSPAIIGGVLAFGAGALVSSVAFELSEEGAQTSGLLPVAIGMAFGALCFYGANKLIDRFTQQSSAGLPLALGALLDGIPEQAVLGIGLASGHGVSVALLVAVFVSNLPEGIGSASDMLHGGRSRRSVLGLWIAVAVLCTLATLGGFAAAQVAGRNLAGGVDGFAAGALLVMLVDSMIPEARDKGGEKAGLLTVLGFAVAAGLSAVG
jgi:zinc transporter, ZIP family